MRRGWVIGFGAVVMVTGVAMAVRLPQSRPVDLLGTVTWVQDGDTFCIQLDRPPPLGTQQSRCEASNEAPIGVEDWPVRLIGIDASEVDPPQCYSSEATEALRLLVGGKRVRLELDAVQIVEERGERRILAYVWLDDLFVNERLIREGLVREAHWFPGIEEVLTVKYRDRLRAAQSAAHAAGLGLWSACGVALNRAPVARFEVCTAQGRCIRENEVLAISGSGSIEFKAEGESSLGRQLSFDPDPGGLDFEWLINGPPVYTTSPDFEFERSLLQPGDNHVLLRVSDENGAVDQVGATISLADATGSRAVIIEPTEGTPSGTLVESAPGISTSPVEPPSADPLIAYTNSGIWITNGAGSFHQQLTDVGSVPQFSPDGTMIAYLDDPCGSAEADECIDVIPMVRVMTIDGIPVESFDVGRILASAGLGPGSFGFSWTPEGMIALDAGMSANGDDRGIWITSLDGTVVEEIANDPHAHEASPVFAPDGAKVAYQSTGSGFNDVNLLDLDTEVLHPFPLGDNAYYGARKYSWSPDGTLLALVTHSQGTPDNYAMLVYNIANSRGGSVAFGTDAYFSDPSWSPDGESLIFTGSQDGDTEIYVHHFKNLDGQGFDFLDGDLSQLTSNVGVSDEEPSWSPDCSQILFTSSRDGDNIFVMNPDGSDVRELATGSDARWSP